MKKMIWTVALATAETAVLGGIMGMVGYILTLIFFNQESLGFWNHWGVGIVVILIADGVEFRLKRAVELDGE